MSGHRDAPFSGPRGTPAARGASRRSLSPGSAPFPIVKGGARAFARGRRRRAGLLEIKPNRPSRSFPRAARPLEPGQFTGHLVKTASRAPFSRDRSPQFKTPRPSSTFRSRRCAPRFPPVRLSAGKRLPRIRVAVLLGATKVVRSHLASLGLGERRSQTRGTAVDKPS
ncbi:hypothetical protein SKAU_G00390680 [Synaphobranchus kaupii]|uniref:Uncharacterized protein n=1 Tax=Synaphobranchus kaupii TaxID=118154 RepID=A0A9Q1EBH8_SYNKA|nr:hypothetical protein SKAU_G00390680 [Synaphobranchus kaupii]